MKIDIVQTNYDMSKKLEEIIVKKTNKLSKYFNDDAVIKVLLKQEKNIFKMEITAMFNGSFIRSEVNGENMYDNIDILLPKIEKQVLKNKEKLKQKFKGSAFKDKEFLYIQSVPTEKVPKIAKTKTFEIYPKSVSEAIDEMNMLEHDFYIYLDEKTNAIQVIYRRNDGDVGVLIPVAER